ncbi:hypothetical protein MKY41_09155 [Sporosarcina sp. FSL W7-1349]
MSGWIRRMVPCGKKGKALMKDWPVHFAELIFLFQLAAANLLL